jgi:hypothetical protein
MSEPGNSIFRNALQISHGHIASMSDSQLNALMEMLIKAQAQRCGSPISEIRINTQGDAPDDGCDGWSGKSKDLDDWLGLDETCWQFKAGDNGTPARLRGEVTKRIPRETLVAGGRFVVITSGSTSGKRGEQKRLATLVAQARAAGVPTEKMTLSEVNVLLRGATSILESLLIGLVVQKASGLSTTGPTPTSTKFHGRNPREWSQSLAVDEQSSNSRPELSFTSTSKVLPALERPDSRLSSAEVLGGEGR